MKTLSEKLLEIEGAYDVLGWQPAETFVPSLLLLVGDDLECVRTDQLNGVWEQVNDAQRFMAFLIFGLEKDGPEALRLLFNDTKDIRGAALMTEGWALVGKSYEELFQKLDTRDMDRVENRSVVGALFGGELLMASRMRGENEADVSSNGSGGLADAFALFVAALKGAIDGDA